MSPEEWIHDKNCLEHMHNRWDRKKNKLEKWWGMLAEKAFKGCQGLGCEESPEVEEEEAPNEDLRKIQHVRADGMSRLAENASAKVTNHSMLILSYHS